MRVVVAPDAFKGCLDAAEVCDAVRLGVLDADPTATVDTVAMADGGEGTRDCLLRGWGGRLVEVDVTGPLGAPVRASYGLGPDGRRAVVELAAASGLTTAGHLSPLHASTRGTGLLVAHALGQGAEEVVLCLGGSATTDGGTGLLRALGYRFLDHRGVELPDGGAALTALAHVDDVDVLPAARRVVVRMACDVDSPLLGPTGAAAVFGPQKGATPAEVELLEAGMRRLADVLRRDTGRDVGAVPGAGAAGGTAAGLLACLSARVEPGAELVADVVGLDDVLAGADLALTGEGRLDEQTARGKVVAVVASRAAAAGVPVHALAGQVSGDLTGLHERGLTSAFALADGPRTLPELLERAAPLLRSVAEQVVRASTSTRTSPRTTNRTRPTHPREA